MINFTLPSFFLHRIRGHVALIKGWQVIQIIVLDLENSHFHIYFIYFITEFMSDNEGFEVIFPTMFILKHWPDGGKTTSPQQILPFPQEQHGHWWGHLQHQLLHVVESFLCQTPSLGSSDLLAWEGNGQHLKNGSYADKSTTARKDQW